jgi:hypothetical protein
VDLQAQVERHDLEIYDHLVWESDSSLLGSSLIDQVGDTDRSMGYLLQGPIYCWITEKGGESVIV